MHWLKLKMEMGMLYKKTNDMTNKVYNYKKALENWRNGSAHFRKN